MGAGKTGAEGFQNTQGGQQIKYPGDSSNSPSPEFEWRGRGTPETGRGNWYNPKTGERWNPDLNHPPPIGPHWDYSTPNGDRFRVFPDGRVEPKP